MNQPPLEVKIYILPPHFIKSGSLIEYGANALVHIQVELCRCIAQKV